MRLQSKYFALLVPIVFILITCSPRTKMIDINLSPIVILDTNDWLGLNEKIKEDVWAQKAFDPILEAADDYLRDSPKALDSIHYEGLIENDPRRQMTKLSLKDSKKVQVLTYAFAGSGAEVYATKALSFIQEWASAYQPTGNPINENKLSPLIASYVQLKQFANEGQNNAISQWVNRIAIKEKEAGYEGERGNWRSKRLKILALCAIALDDEDILKHVKLGVSDYIDTNFFPDSSTIDLRHRDALSYHCGGIKPLLSILLILQNEYPDIYQTENSQGGSVKKSVDYLIPYAKGLRVYPQWVNSSVEFDRERWEAGDPKYKPGTLWDPKSGVDVFNYAQFFDPGLKQILKQLMESNNIKYPTFESLLSEF